MNGLDMTFKILFLLEDLQALHTFKVSDMTEHHMTKQGMVSECKGWRTYWTRFGLKGYFKTIMSSGLQYNQHTYSRLVGAVNP